MKKIVAQFGTRYQMISQAERHVPLTACSVSGLFPGTGCGALRRFQI